MDAGRCAARLWRLRGPTRGHGESLAEVSQNDDVQRAIGRIEGTQAQIISKLDAIIVTHVQHENDDRRDFASIRAMFDHKMAAAAEVRETHLGQQDEKLLALKQDADRAKGAGWVILGLLGSLAAFAGGSVIAALTGHLHFQ
jgi:hypothetical protein